MFRIEKNKVSSDHVQTRKNNRRGGLDITNSIHALLHSRVSLPLPFDVSVVIDVALCCIYDDVKVIETTISSYQDVIFHL